MSFKHRVANGVSSLSIMSDSEHSSSSEGEPPVVVTLLKQIDQMGERIGNGKMFPNSVRQKSVDLWNKGLQAVRAWAEKVKDLPEDVDEASDDQLMEVYRIRANFFFTLYNVTGGQNHDQFAVFFCLIPIQMKDRRRGGLFLPTASVDEACVQFGAPWGMKMQGGMKYPPEFENAAKACNDAFQWFSRLDEDLKPAWTADNDDIGELRCDFNTLWQTCQELMLPIDAVTQRRDDTLLPRVKSEFGIDALHADFHLVLQNNEPQDLPRLYKAWFPKDQTEFLQKYNEFERAFNEIQELVFNAKEDPPIRGCCAVA